MGLSPRVGWADSSAQVQLGSVGRAPSPGKGRGSCSDARSGVLPGFALAEILLGGTCSKKLTSFLSKETKKRS